MKLIQWETVKPFMGGMSDGVDHIGLSSQNYYELKHLKRVEAIGSIFYRFNYYILRVKKIGDIQTKLVPFVFPVSLEQVRRRTTARGIEHDFMQYVDIEVLEKNISRFTSGLHDFRILHRKFYHEVEKEVLYQDIEDGLIQYGFIHGLKKFQKLED